LEGSLPKTLRRKVMKVWMKPQVREQEVGLEVTSYLPAEIDVI
jgi:coenzyme PQQ precursor peptide PqqA